VWNIFFPKRRERQRSTRADQSTDVTIAVDGTRAAQQARDARQPLAGNRASRRPDWETVLAEMANFAALCSYANDKRGHDFAVPLVVV
jgi:hypothetical protein